MQKWHKRQVSDFKIIQKVYNFVQITLLALLLSHFSGMLRVSVDRYF